MRVPLAILFSVCVIVGLGQLVQTNATVTEIEVPASAFVMETAPTDMPATTSTAKVEVKINNELPTPPPIFVPPANDLAINTNCPRCPVYVPPVNVPATCEPAQTTEAGQEGRVRPVLGLVGGAVKAVGCLAGVERRAARRAARRGG